MAEKDDACEALLRLEKKIDELISIVAYGVSLLEKSGEKGENKPPRFGPAYPPPPSIQKFLGKKP